MRDTDFALLALLLFFLILKITRRSKHYQHPHCIVDDTKTSLKELAARVKNQMHVSIGL